MFKMHIVEFYSYLHSVSPQNREKHFIKPLMYIFILNMFFSITIAAAIRQYRFIMFLHGKCILWNFYYTDYTHHQQYNYNWVFITSKLHCVGLVSSGQNLVNLRFLQCEQTGKYSRQLVWFMLVWLSHIEKFKYGLISLS